MPRLPFAAEGVKSIVEYKKIKWTTDPFSYSKLGCLIFMPQILSIWGQILLSTQKAFTASPYPHFPLLQLTIAPIPCSSITLPTTGPGKLTLQPTAFFLSQFE